MSLEAQKKTIHVNLRVRAIDDVQSPDVGALCFRKGEVVMVSEIEAVGKAYGTYYNKKGWFALDQVVVEPHTSPRGSSLISPRNAGASGGGSMITNPGSTISERGQLTSSGSGVSPSPPRSQRPTAKKLTSFIWKTRDERLNEVTGGAAQLTTSGEELEKPEVEKQSKKPSDMIKMRLMWRKSVSEKVSPTHTKRVEFGMPIEELACRDNAIRGIPYVVFVLITHLAENALDLEGVFRISVSFLDLQEMKEMLETGPSRMMDPKANTHAVASTLKQFLRELPDPLLTFALYDRWMNTGELSNMAERKEKLIELIKELPESHQHTLHFLMTFLKALSLRSEVNKMSTLNLGVVFAPTILRRKVETKDDFMRMETQRGIVETFLDDYEDIFPKLYPSEEDPTTGPWVEEQLLGVLRPTEKELNQLRRLSNPAGGSVIGGMAHREDLSTSQAYIRDHSPASSPSGSMVELPRLPLGDGQQLASSQLREQEKASPDEDDGESSDASDGEEEKDVGGKAGKKGRRGRSKSIKLKEKEREKEEREREKEKRKKEKEDRKSEKKREKTAKELGKQDLVKRRAISTGSPPVLAEVEASADEKAQDIGALAKELNVQVENLKKEGKWLEQENENKRMEWMWLDQERAKLEAAVKALKQELEEKQQERSKLEEENKRPKSDHSSHRSTSKKSRSRSHAHE